MDVKIASMSNEEYEKYALERLRLEKEIDHTSLLMSTIKEEGVCPFCHSMIETMDKIRERHIQKMREYNKFVGQKHYVAHIEGNRKWEI